jgi:hypothetical protein
MTRCIRGIFRSFCIFCLKYFSFIFQTLQMYYFSTKFPLVNTLCRLVYKLCEDIANKDFPLCAKPLMHCLPLLITICNTSNSHDSKMSPNKPKSAARSRWSGTLQLSVERVITVWVVVRQHTLCHVSKNTL